MLICYSSQTNEVALIARRDEFAGLASLLTSPGHGVVQASEGSKGAYDKLLQALSITTSLPGCRVSIRENGRGELLIVGDADNLKVLSMNIREFAEKGGEDAHLHVEYFPGHFYLDADSASAVFSFG